MIKLFSTALFAMVTVFTVNAQVVFKSKPEASSISFFSKATMEDIDAVNKRLSVVLRPATNDILFGVTMTGFKFKSALMETHFNETYVESDKFPTCIFKGKVIDKIDYLKDGENKVTVKGTMELHGVTKEIEATGTITIIGKEIHVLSVFKIKLADFKIEVPSNKLTSIAEVIDITVDATLIEIIKK